MIDQPLTIDPEKVTKQGILRKKGNHLYSYRFKKKYYYLEENCLKFGSVKDHPTNKIELSTGMVEVTVSSKYRTQFKIIYHERGRKDKLKLKAENEADRDDWVMQLRKVTEQFKGLSPMSSETFRGGFS